MTVTTPNELFFVDRKFYESCQNSDQAISTYETREPGYFATIMAVFKKYTGCTVNQLLQFETFDRMHNELMGHFPQPAEGWHCSANHFELSPNSTTDHKGLVDLITKIHEASKPEFYLDIISHSAKSRFYYLKDRLQICNYDTGQVQRISLITLEHAIALICRPFFEDKSEIKLNTLLPSHKRKVIVSRALSELRQQLPTENVETRMRAIASAMRTISQTHLYSDGNARSTFVLANLLLIKHGDSPFYPEVQSLFDCQSDDTLVTKMQQGQEEFLHHFGQCDNAAWFTS